MSSRPVSENPVVDPVQLRRNRFVLVLIVAVLLLPFAIGHLAYFQGWFAGGKTNKGNLLTPPAMLPDLQLHNSKGQVLGVGGLERHWWLVYVLPPQCSAACRNSLFQMRQVRRAAGAEAERVRLMLVQPQQPDAATEALLASEFQDITRVTAEAATLDAGLAVAGPQSSAAGRVYIMDPRGAIMLDYAPQVDEKTSILKSQDILDDLMKLLGASQIG